MLHHHIAVSRGILVQLLRLKVVTGVSGAANWISLLMSNLKTDCNKVSCLYCQLLLITRHCDVQCGTDPTECQSKNIGCFHLKTQTKINPGRKKKLNFSIKNEIWYKFFFSHLRLLSGLTFPMKTHMKTRNNMNEVNLVWKSVISLSIVYSYFYSTHPMVKFHLPERMVYYVISSVVTMTWTGTLAVL